MPIMSVILIVKFCKEMFKTIEKNLGKYRKILFLKRKNKIKNIKKLKTIKKKYENKKMKSLKKFIMNNFIPFICTSTIMGSGFLGYLSYKMHKNKTTFEKLQQDDKFKDTTRLDYDFYGLNWGVASDNMVHHFRKNYILIDF